MKYIVAVVPFAVMLVSFSIILGTSANAASELSKGDVQKGAPLAVVAILTCSMIGVLMYGARSLGKMHGRGSGSSKGLSMPSTPYPAA